MTGTGTELDPYRVGTWDEFLEALNAGEEQYPQKYIKWNDNPGIIDFNEISPLGFTPITIKAYVDFNGWAFKNIYVHDTDYVFRLDIKNVEYYFKNGNFLNMYLENVVYIFSHAYSWISGNYYGYISNCKFSGVVFNSKSFAFSANRSVRIKYIGNSINLKVRTLNNGGSNNYDKGVAAIVGIYDTSTNYEHYYYNNIKIDYTCSSLCLFNGSYGSYNLITGKVNITSFSDNYLCCGTGTQGYNVYNLSVTGAENDLIYSVRDNSSLCIYNSDLCTVKTSDKLAPVTSDNMKNAEYIWNLGFPIGV